MHAPSLAVFVKQDIANLARLPSLKHLSLADQHWGDNPVCSLCNYATYVLYQLPGLVTMDAAYVLDDAKVRTHAVFSWLVKVRDTRMAIPFSLSGGIRIDLC